MNVKIEQIEERGSLKGIAKKIRCPEHDFKFVYKCEYPNCTSPFVCSAFECIDSHAHEDDKFMFTRFTTQSIASKFYAVQNLINDDSLTETARQIKNYIDSLKEMIKPIFSGIKTINQNYIFLRGDLEAPLNPEYIQKVQQNYILNQTVSRDIEEIKKKVKMEFPLKNSLFAMKQHLNQFLVQNISGFNWSKAQEIFSSQNQPITIERFHQKLAGKKDLCFIFVGETNLIGSYFAQPYPTIAEKACKDTQSFIFINKENNPTKFAKFNALKEPEQHLLASEKNYICQGNTPSYGDGLITFHKNIDSLGYCLPSNSFAHSQGENETFSGTLKVKRFMILQVNKEIHENGDLD